MPDLAAISVGVRNKFHHPSPVVVRRYRSLGIGLERTDENGAAVYESDGETWTETDWRNP
jgi:competence protein ComEC